MNEILWEGGIGNKILCFFAFVTRRLFFLLISMVYISLIGRYLIEFITLIMQKTIQTLKSRIILLLCDKSCLTIAASYYICVSNILVFLILYGKTFFSKSLDMWLFIYSL